MKSPKIIQNALFSLIGLLVGYAHAQSVFTNRGAWQTAVGTFSTETFNAAPVGLLHTGTTPLGTVNVTLNDSGNGNTRIWTLDYNLQPTNPLFTGDLISSSQA